MPEFGSTLKHLRQLRGLTQAALYDGIISRSFAGRLERNQHSLTADKLAQILDRLAVSPSEFQFILQDHHYPSDTALLNHILVAYDQRNFPRLRHLEQAYRTSDRPTERDLATLAQLLIRITDQLHWSLTPEMTALWHRLNAATTWTLSDFLWAQVWLMIAAVQRDIPQLLAGIAKMHVSCDRYVTADGDAFHVLAYRSSFDLLAFQILLTLHRDQAARDFRPAFTPPHQEYLTDSQLLIYRACDAIWEWYFGDVAAGTALAQPILALSPLGIATDIGEVLTLYRRKARTYRQSQQKGV